MRIDIQAANDSIPRAAFAQITDLVRRALAAHRRAIGAVRVRLADGRCAIRLDLEGCWRLEVEDHDTSWPRALCRALDRIARQVVEIEEGHPAFAPELRQ